MINPLKEAILASDIISSTNHQCWVRLATFPPIDQETLSRLKPKIAAERYFNLRLGGPRDKVQKMDLIDQVETVDLFAAGDLPTPGSDGEGSEK